jgi:hypothetical protein
MINEQPQVSRTFGVSTDSRSTGLPEPAEQVDNQELSFTLPDFSLADQLEEQEIEPSVKRPIATSPRFAVTADPRHTGLRE